MARETKLFHSKLRELDKQYLLMRTRISLAQSKRQERLFEEIESLRDEIAENNVMLKESIAYSRSPAISKLSDAHLDYCRRMQELAKDLPRYMGETNEEKSEAAALYAEYAMDFATQADRFALLAALEAIYIQNDKTEENP